jgi:methylthioribose-1-phosphate isomerase
MEKDNILHGDRIRAVEWVDGRLKLLDQRRLPHACDYLTLETAAQVADAIRQMVVRGAPAIGIAAAYGVAIAANEAYARAGRYWREVINPDIERLLHARPTAVNLRWAVERMRGVLPKDNADPRPRLMHEAMAIHLEDITANRRMGDLGALLLSPGTRIMTHCNAGALATGGYGTALGVIRSAFGRGLIEKVYAGETRPWLQGARLTAWELLQDGIPVTLLADSAAALLMRRGALDWVVVGADRIAANGDVANKIGTYSLALAARAHGVKFMVAAPISTMDMNSPDGNAIHIEERTGDELLTIAGQPLAAIGAWAWNPVFDVTPAELVDVIVTERGAIQQPDNAKLRALLGSVA